MHQLNLAMATVEKPQPMDVDPKKVEEKVEEKLELVNINFCRVIIQSNIGSTESESLLIIST